jgi:hypothetical protein
MEIWSWCSERDMFLTAQYIPGNENLRSENQFWAGQNGTIKIAFSTLSLMIFNITFPIKLNDGKI